MNFKLRLFLSILLISAVFASFNGWPENSHFDLTRSMVEEGILSINSYHTNTGDKVKFEGNYYSDKFPGLSIIVNPFYYLIHDVDLPVSSNIHDQDLPRLNWIVFFFLVLIFSATPHALSTVIMYELCGEKTKGLILSIGFALGTILLNLSTYFFGYNLAILFLLISYYLATKNQNKYVSAFLIFAAVLIRPFAIFTIPIFFFCFRFKKQIVVSSIMFIILLGLFNYSQFQNPYTVSYRYSANSETFDLAYYTPLLSACFANSKDPIYLVPWRQKLNCSGKLHGNFSKIDSQYINVESSFGDKIIHPPNSSNLEFYFAKRNETIKLKRSVVNDTQYFSFSRNNNTYANYLEYSLNETSSNYYHVTTSSSWSNNCNFWPAVPKKINACNETGFFGRSNIVRREYDINLNYITFNESPEIIEFEYIFNIYSDSKTTLLFQKVTNLLFYPYRGLFFYCPFLLLIFWKKWSKFDLIVFFSFFMALLYNANQTIWWSGTSYGPRFLSLFIPFFVISISNKKINLNLILSLVILSILINVLGFQSLTQSYLNTENVVYVESEYWNILSDWKIIDNPIYNYYLPETIINGPQSFLLEKIFLTDFYPWVNTLFLFLILLLIWKLID